MVHSFSERRVEGIVVTSSRVGALYLPLLSEMRIPIVLVNNQHPGEFVNSVLIENVKASAEVTNHLIQLGHSRIAYLGDRFGYQSDMERFGGYREALERAGLPFLPELVVHGDGKCEGGMAGVETLLGLPDPPTAIFCYNDMTALWARFGNFICEKCAFRRMFRWSASTICSLLRTPNRLLPPCASLAGLWDVWPWRVCSSSYRERIPHV